MNGTLYNQWTAKHGTDGIRIGHDVYLRWYVVKDKKWKMMEDARTLKGAKESAHRIFHDGSKCEAELHWNLDNTTVAQVLGACPACTNPEMDSDLKTYRSCPDCGWRIDFTPEEIDRLEKMLKGPLAF